MTKVVAALKKAGIADRDIQTSSLNVSPQYVYEQNQPPKLNGYQASNQVTIQVRDLTKLGQTVDATVGAGATNVGGISFGLQNLQAAEDAARLDAVKALQAKADLYARATGYKIVRMVTLGEGGGYTLAAPDADVRHGQARDGRQQPGLGRRAEGAGERLGDVRTGEVGFVGGDHLPPTDRFAIVFPQRGRGYAFGPSAPYGGGQAAKRPGGDKWAASTAPPWRTPLPPAPGPRGPAGRVHPPSPRHRKVPGPACQRRPARGPWPSRPC